MKGLSLTIALLLGASVHGTASPVTRPDLTEVDVAMPPWSAVGRINNSAYGRCSAVLIRPQVVVTAAHCLYNRRSGQFLEPASIHVLFGFNRGRYAVHATVTEIAIPPGYDPNEAAASAPYDRAVLRLSQPVPDRFPPLLPIAQSELAKASIRAAGFAQERSEVMTTSQPCKILGTTPTKLLVTDCRISHGFSGGPVIDMETGHLIGVVIASAIIDGKSVALAIPTSRMLDAVP